MEETKNESTDIRSMIRGVIDEFVRNEQVKSEPAYKAELVEERRRREQLEQRVNELVQENQKSRQMADEADRNSTVRTELQRLGVQKVDLAYRAVRDDIARSEDGRLVARSPQGEQGLRDYLQQFVTENPELLPARIAGGSGQGPVQKTAPSGSGFDLEKLHAGMSPEELDKIRREISRVANQTMRGI